MGVALEECFLYPYGVSGFTRQDLQIQGGPAARMEDSVGPTVMSSYDHLFPAYLFI